MEPNRHAAILLNAPLEEPVRGHCATPPLKRIPEGRQFLNRLRASVDGLKSLLPVGHPEVDQAPPGWKQLTILEPHSNDPMLVGRANVVARPIANERLERDSQF